MASDWILKLRVDKLSPSVFLTRRWPIKYQPEQKAGLSRASTVLSNILLCTHATFYLKLLKQLGHLTTFDEILLCELCICHLKLEFDFSSNGWNIRHFIVKLFDWQFLSICPISAISEGYLTVTFSHFLIGL